MYQIYIYQCMCVCMFMYICIILNPSIHIYYLCMDRDKLMIKYICLCINRHSYFT